MIQPNNDAKLFCEWMLDFGLVRLTASQQVVAGLIIESVNTVTPVSLNTWKNFFKFSPQYYAIWKQNVELQA